MEPAEYVKAYRRVVDIMRTDNADWTEYPGFTSLLWKDARPQNKQRIINAWLKETSKDRYLKKSAELYQQLDYMK